MIPHDPHHLGVPLGASKTISEPMVRLAQNLCTYLTSTLTPSPNRPNEITHDPRDLGVPSGASKTISEPMVRLAKPCTYLTSTLTPSPNRPNEIPHDPRHQVRPKRYLSLWYV